MIRGVLGIAFGIFCGFGVTWLCQLPSYALYPPPEGLDFKDVDAMGEWIKTLPAGAFIIVLFSHAAGAFAAGLVCILIKQEVWNTGVIILGVLFLIAGIMNLVMIPHPIWFAVVDLALYIPAAIAGAKLAMMIVPKRKKTAEPKKQS
jgi:hypothetical protein